MNDFITAVYADEDGNILDAAGLEGMGRTGRENVPVLGAAYRVRVRVHIRYAAETDLLLCSERSHDAANRSYTSQVVL